MIQLHHRIYASFWDQVNTVAILAQGNHWIMRLRNPFFAWVQPLGPLSFCCTLSKRCKQNFTLHLVYNFSLASVVFKKIEGGPQPSRCHGCAAPSIMRTSESPSRVPEVGRKEAQRAGRLKFS